MRAAPSRLGLRNSKSCPRPAVMVYAASETVGRLPTVMTASHLRSAQTPHLREHLCC